MKLIKISKLVKLRVYIKFVFWESIVYRNYLENNPKESSREIQNCSNPSLG